MIGELYDPRTVDGSYDPFDRNTWGPGGRAPLLYDARLRGSGHHVRIGGSGAGKTESLKTTLQGPWNGPLVVLDPKQTLGEQLLDYRRRMGRKVIIVDPQSADTCGTNALTWLNWNDPLLDAHIDDVVEWVCGETPEHSGGSNEKFFNGAAKDKVRCLISHICADTEADPAVRCLRTMRAIICSEEKLLRGYLEAIRDTSPSMRARELASGFCGDGDDTLRGIRYTAQRMTGWLSTKCWSDLVCGDSYRTSDIIDGDTDIALDIPFQSLQSEPAVTRCILGALFNEVFRRPEHTRSQLILFSLDEVAQLRRFDPLKTMWTMGREFGGRLDLLYQGRGQITDQWGHSGKSIIDNGASVICYSSIKNLDDAKELEQIIGTYPAVAVAESTQNSTQSRALRFLSRSRGNTVSYSEMGIPRLRHEEIMFGLREDAQIVIANGIRPFICGLPLAYRREVLNGRSTN